jgi:multiple sugar transport system permease protein
MKHQGFSMSTPATRPKRINRVSQKVQQARVLQAILLYFGIAVFVIATLAPVAWLILSSVSSNSDLTDLPLRWLPNKLDFSRYTALLQPGGAGAEFIAAMRNSLVITLGATFLSIMVAIPAAYSFSRSKGVRGNLLYAVLATYMIPPVALVLPLYSLLSALHLLNTTFGLTLVYCTILTPFTTWLLKTNFDAVPLEIEESAQLDGLSRWAVLYRIVIPLALPGLSTATVWAILLGWDEFFYALIFTSNANAKTLPIAIADFAAGRAVDYGLICAAGALAAVPPLIIGFLLQKGLMSGLTSGSVKG